MQHQVNQKLKSILLIDDSPSANFMHQVILDEIECSENLEFKKNGKEAIEFLKDCHSEECRPDIIFLDINMPVMNGWDFLVQYEQLRRSAKKDPVIIMLTASQNPSDLTKAKSFEGVKEYMMKPLRKERILEILEKELDWKKAS